MKVAAALALVALVTVFAGYSQHEHLTLAGDVNDDVQQAANDWSRAVGVRFGRGASTCEGVETGVICVHIVSDEQFADLGYDANTLGVTHTDLKHSGAEMWVRRNGGGGVAVLPVLRHELGHALGLHHSAPGTLMSPSQDVGSPTITVDDVAQYHLIRHNLKY